MAKTRKASPKPSRSQADSLRQAEEVFARRYPPRPQAGAPEIVDPRWLLKAAALAILAAVLCAYATLCLLVYQGQWQLLLHPAAGALPNVSPPQEIVHFGAGETGRPELAGLWLPAPSQTPTTPTILYLPDGSGNLAADAQALREFAQLPVNIFALDYRGFGASTPSSGHPSEARMQADASAAFDDLTGTRHLRAESIVPYGVGLGGSLAVALARQHPEVPALILEAPRPNAAEVARSDSRARLVPLRVFQHDRFDLDLASLKTRTLLLDAGPSAAQPTPDAVFKHLAGISSPSMTVHLTTPGSAPSPSLWRNSILRFLDEYVAAPTGGPGARP